MMTYTSGDTEQLSHHQAGGHTASYDGQWRGRGDHEEHDVRNTQQAAVQVRRLRLLGGAVSPVVGDRHGTSNWTGFSPSAGADYSGIVRIQTIVSRGFRSQSLWTLPYLRAELDVWTQTTDYRWISCRTHARSPRPSQR